AAAALAREHDRPRRVRRERGFSGEDDHQRSDPQSGAITLTLHANPVSGHWALRVVVEREDSPGPRCWGVSIPAAPLPRGLEKVGVQSFELLDLGRDHEAAVAVAAVLVVVVLVVVLGGVELTIGQQLGHDRRAVGMSGLELGDGLLRRGTLLG